jgi:Flp pilus assembly protein TadG
MLGDRGAVAVEFALITFPMLLLLGGLFGVGFVMVQYMQLNFIVENAAKVQLASAMDGATWARAQLNPAVSSQATFTVTSPSLCGGPPPAQAALVTGTWPVSMGIFDALTVTLSAQACAVK